MCPTTGSQTQPAASPSRDEASEGCCASVCDPVRAKALLGAVDASSKAVPADLATGLTSVPKQLPCRFLYDDLGWVLYEQITQLEEYYPYLVEHGLLEAHVGEIINTVPRGSLIVELGVGDGSKTALLLNACITRDGRENVSFCGVDCSAEALNQCRSNLGLLCPQLDPSRVSLVEAEYLEGVAHVRQQHPGATLCLLWLGSSVGNFAHGAAVDFLRAAAAAAAGGGGMQLLLCTDLWKDAGVLHAAYHDSKGVTEAFIKNGMRHALRILGQPEAAGDPANWAYDCVVNPELQQVEMWLVARHAVPEVLPGVGIAAGERVLMEVSRKFTEPCIADMAHKAGLCIQAAWGDERYRMTLLLPPREALLRAWADTDAMFDSIANWGAQPIGLRHPFSFYYGHCAAFTKLKLLAQEEASGMDEMMSRGVDPNVLDPSECHSHPDVPAAWPSQEVLLEYVSQTRAKVLSHVEGAGFNTSCEAHMHALAMGLEHERMHQETLCYMLAQQRKHDYLARAQGAAAAAGALAEGAAIGAGAGAAGVPPFYKHQAGYPRPGAATVAAAPAGPPTPATRAGRAAGKGHNEGSVADGLEKEEEVVAFVKVPGTKVRLGLGLGAQCGYAWDNELGEASREVAPFLVAPAPITVEEMREFILVHKGYERPELWDAVDFTQLASSGQTMPATWSRDPAGDFLVHMPEATYPWAQVAGCPAYVSLAEALAYCRLHGGQVMTEEEHAAACQHAQSAAGVGSLAGLQEGGWEWTASALEPFAGFAPDSLYPEYSADFFDGCHYVLKGSSPYTHPSVRRASFRNFYQRQYPYVFAKFRLARKWCE